MILVEVYSKKDCHLCEVAMAVLRKLQPAHHFDLRKIEIQKGDEHFEDFKEQIPVVFINKEFAFRHRVPEEEFIARLQRASQRDHSAAGS